MPKKAGGSGDAELADVGAEPRLASTSIGFPSAGQDDASASDASAAPQPKAPAFAAPRPLSEVSFDDAKPAADFPAAASEPMTPTFLTPKPRSEAGFGEAIPEPPRSAPPMPGFPAPAPQVASAAGMGILITGAPGMSGPPTTPKQTPAQLSAANQALRIRLLRPDGKPFDGPEITTGPKQSDGPQGTSRTEFDSPRGLKKQAPKVVVKAGPLERAGHTLAVLLISAVGVVPLGYLLTQSVHDREDKLAARISVPTKMNVLDSTSEACLGGMLVVLLVVTALYWTRLKRRRER